MTTVGSVQDTAQKAVEQLLRVWTELGLDAGQRQTAFEGLNNRVQLVYEEELHSSEQLFNSLTEKKTELGERLAILAKEMNESIPALVRCR